jgi:hypothetical protein
MRSVNAAKQFQLCAKDVYRNGSKDLASKFFSFTPGFSPVREQPPNLATVSTVFWLFRIETVETVLNQSSFAEHRAEARCE